MVKMMISATCAMKTGVIMKKTNVSIVIVQFRNHKFGVTLGRNKHCLGWTAVNIHTVG